MREIATYLGELSEKIELFEVYKKSVDLEPEVLDKFFGILVDIAIAGASAIKYFRKNDINRALALGTWSNVDRQFSRTLQDFAARIDHLKQLVEAHQLTEMNLKQNEVLESLSRHSIADGQRQAANLPYYQLPFGRNPSFYGRTRILNEISDLLKPSNAGQSIRSVALWGTGGIGKSQTALEYANFQIQAKCQLVLWLPAQTESDMSRALVNAASHVRPPGYEEGMTADRIRLTMWNWLQTTGKYLI